MPDVRTSVFYGGTSQKNDTEILKNKDTCPHIVVATPGRLNSLVRDKSLNASNVKHFVLDECDKLLDTVGQFCSSKLRSSFTRHACTLTRPRT
jgi:ATP-dependent RNA helicase UAP56/SUB2